MSFYSYASLEITAHASPLCIQLIWEAWFPKPVFTVLSKEKCGIKKDRFFWVLIYPVISVYSVLIYPGLRSLNAILEEQPAPDYVPNIWIIQLMLQIFLNVVILFPYGIYLEIW